MKTRKILTKEVDEVNNYMVIELSYSRSIMLPYADGIAVLAAMKKAELITGSIHEVQTGELKFEPKEQLSWDIVTVPQRVYREAKMDLLLGLEPKVEDGT